MSNRLAAEQSPYLLQHANNPVDWYPWGDEAFETARAEDKAIFLSIGYSTCHWCHVMERESFENDDVAAVLNRLFVSIKVDREERPDVDRVYMTAMQLMGLGGGWPLTVFLTPDLTPFYGGTYFPARTIPGRIGLVELLPSVETAWREKRAQVIEQGAHVVEALASMTTRDADTGTDPATLLDAAEQALLDHEDVRHGGFGAEPKFPQPSNLVFLFRRHATAPEQRAGALAAALRQLDAMRLSGIHDQLGGGFHRYATDRIWLVPHFEKMLYDQAQLAWCYLAGFQLTGRAEYADTARGIFDYVRRDLTSPDGASWSAEDADSEGEEGRFYVWTPAQVEATLAPDVARAFMARYGVTPGGNFEHGTSILHEARSLADVAREAGWSDDATLSKLDAARATLLAARATRPRPHLDDKVLTAWNGLMISAFARGARVLGDSALADAAVRAAEFTWTRLRDPESGALWRRWRDGEAALPGQLDDHAYAAYGFVDLYRATFDPVWLERAVALVEVMIRRFGDDAQGGFFESPAGDSPMGVRLKTDHDGAENSGASIGVTVLLVLGRLLDRRDWLERAARALAFHARRLAAHPTAMPQLLAALDLAGDPPRHIVVAGERESARPLVAAFDARYAPEELLLLVDSDATRARLAALAPFVGPLRPRDGHATAHVCVGYACRLPTTDLQEFSAQLDALSPARPHPGAIA